jgi:hypothetical protein
VPAAIVELYLLVLFTLPMIPEAKGYSRAIIMEYQPILSELLK